MERRQKNLTVDDYTKMIERDPNNDNLYVERGMLYGNQGDFNKAKEDFTKAIQLNPSCFSAYNNRGNIYISEKLYDLALTDYTRCIKINPAAVQSYINRGIVYEEMRDYPSAIQDYTQAIALNPADYEVYLFRWKLYNALGEEKLAEADLEKAHTINPFATEHWIQRRMNPPLDPASAEAHIQNSLESFASHEYDIAIAEATEAIKIGSKHDAVAYSNRGMAHVGKGNDALTFGIIHTAQIEYTLAIADYKKVLELDPEDADAKTHSNLGIAYHQLQDYANAIENLTWAIDRLSKFSNLDADDTKTFSNSLYYRGRSYAMTRKFSLAKKDFEKILTINPADYEVKQMLRTVSQMDCENNSETSETDDVFNQGLFYAFEAKDNDKAIKAFTQVIKTDPKFYSAFLNRGNCYFKKGLYDKAIADYDNVLSLNPHNIDAYKIRAWALYFQDWSAKHPNHLDALMVINQALDAASERKSNKALKKFEQAIQMSSNNAFTFYQRGLVYAQIGERIKAIKDLTTAAEFAPAVAAVYYDRGNCYRHQKLLDRAIDDYTLAIGLYPQFIDAFCNRGGAYIAQGEYLSAKKDFEAALNINPDDSEAKNNLHYVMRLLKK
jgi:tetratricopeptide (TPR) repeat protein